MWEPRRYSSVPLPRSRHLPGVSPRSSVDRRLLAWLESCPPPLGFGPDSWASSVHYLYAVDLFNFGFWWESHAAWEVVWRAAEKESLPALFVQGLIQVAAALLKRSQSRDTAAERLLSRGLERLGLAPEVFLGVEVEPFTRSVRLFLSGEIADPPHIVLLGLQRGR